MKKHFTVAVLGAGGRGYAYSRHFTRREEFEVVAACDYNPAQLEKMKKAFGIEALFLDEVVFFEEKRADILVIATCDSDHVRQCVRAMKMGYDILLEKPISDSEEEIAELLRVQKETGRKVVVCHVLRYSPAICKLDELLASGVLGKLIAIDHIERVAFWHQAQAYVRIQKMYHDTQHPTILAKCCHDLDLIQHFAASRCKTVSSVGGLTHFQPENAPEGATKRCLDCPHIDTCTYSAKKIYIDFWKARGCPAFQWPWTKVSLQNPNTEESLYAGLEDTVFGECAYQCGVEQNPHVVDHQMVQMEFENGVIANLKMLFTAEPGRRINFFGTEGEIVFDERTDTIEVRPYFCEKEIIQLSTMNESGWGHGGGDYGLVNSMYEILTDSNVRYTSLTESVESHLMGICAEQSRLSGGQVVTIRRSL
ncbi:MAG: Gfo/Idh/MocA family oxidoreductase [Clostridia bacterium]|nr:Gfo/Idh/MocA family oxidoreductase [Clostridia bacterium]